MPASAPDRNRLAQIVLRPSLIALLVVAAACKTAPPPPPPEPAEIAPAPAEPPAPPQVWGKTTGSRLNVRASASTKAEIVARLKRGERVEIASEQPGWYEIKLPDGTIGWVSAQYLAKEARCLPDKATAELLNEPPIALSDSGPHGRVVLEATVNATGTVASTKLIQNTTGSAELAKTATEEIKQLRFSPPVKRCKPVPFIYTYTRSF